jgi:AcrR family transcriptional regulator
MAKYHHGNLRQRLIEIATELLAEDGVSDLSLRKIAHRAGVSHNAPYMHFADKEAVLAAIAEAGFQILATEVKTAISTAGDSNRQQLLAASHAYVRFALDRPYRLQVMFCAYDESKYPSVLVAARASLDRLLELVKDGQQQGELIAGNPQEMTKAIWAMVHGVATLSIAYKTQMLLPDKTSTEASVSVFVKLLLDGLAA